jgi:hypothetical protein
MIKQHLPLKVLKLKPPAILKNKRATEPLESV